jgi:hypothetical protein
MAVPDIELTAEEQTLFDAIELDWDAMDRAAFIENGHKVVALMKSLLARKGIPAERMSYFMDPKYQTGRMKGSHRDLFHSNGHNDDTLMRHAHFLDHLRYFVCGADLPASAISAFRKEVAGCGTVTSSDVLPLGNFARRETRERGLPPQKACEEYFKLALDCGMGLSHARAVRDRVKTIR